MEMLPAYVYGPAPAPREAKPQPEGTVECDGCRGDGVYYGAGGTVNGHFVGFKGKCFRCHGRGWQTPADVKRNRYYDDHVRRYDLSS